MGALPDFSPDIPARRPKRKRYSERLQELNKSTPLPSRAAAQQPRHSQPITPARALASLAFVAGPALVANLILGHVLKPQVQPPLEDTTSAALRTQVQAMQTWLKEADRHTSPSALTTRLQAIQDRLSGLPASQCHLLSRNELLDLNSRLTIDLASGGAAVAPSWQSRYNDQVSIAERNLHSCLNG